LLRDADWAGMAHSLEIRVPLVDAKLLADTAPLALQDAQWNKQRLAQAPSQSLTEEITNRAKTGFTTPIGEWIGSSGLQNVGAERKHPPRLDWARDWSRAINAAVAGG